MQLTNEAGRTRRIGLWGAWIFAAALLCVHAAVIRENLRILNSVGLRGAAVSPTPMKSVVPTMFADAQMWVRHALALAHGDGPQMRYTYADNAPYGREVHWNSGLAWAIAGAGSLRRAFTHEPLTTAIEGILPWFNVPLLLAFAIILSTWVSRRAGLGAGLIVVFAMIGHFDFYGTFAPDYVDHHGILAAAVLGLLFGAIFMGAGLRRENAEPGQLLPATEAEARRAAVFSAVCGAIGMWVSAATLIPAIGIVGVAGALTVLSCGKRAKGQGVQIDPWVWRLWGNVGAALCLGFYLLEYFPKHLGFRMEVNHPAYAAAWWAGAEILAQLAEWRAAPRGTFRPHWGWLATAVVALSIAPIIIIIGGAKVFVVFDPFVSQLSRSVAEGIPLREAIQIFGWMPFSAGIVWTIVGVVLLAIAWWRCGPADRAVLLFCAVTLGAFWVMEWEQIRWGSSTASPQICLVVVALAALVRSSRPILRWSLVGAIAIVLGVIPLLVRISVQEANNVRHSVEQADSIQPVYRDIAAALRASQPEGQLIVLSSPNGSAAIGYYGLFETVGTLYWENLAGTKAAAKIFSSMSEVEARRRIRERHITHIALVSHDNFLGEYYQLLHPGATAEEVKKSFGVQLLFNGSVPMWLEQIPYQLPPDVPFRPDRVALFKTKFTTPAADTLFEAALTAYEAGRKDEAAAKLDQALALAPTSPEFWVAETNLLLERGDNAGAARAVLSAMQHAEGAQVFTICSAEGSRFYQHHLHAAAAQLYQKALSVRFDPLVANNLVWLLATSTDDHVRNGPEALKLADQLAAMRNQPMVLNAYAAALAECGRFNEAAEMAAKTVEAIRKTESPAVVSRAEARLTAYREGKAWRE